MNSRSRIQKLLDGWHLQNVANHEDAQDFANAFIVAEFINDPAPEDQELNIDLVERMAREHWEQASAQVDVAKEATMKPIIGSIGVMTDDDTPAQLWEFLGFRYGAIGHFRNIVSGAQWDRDIGMFWPLLDSLP